MKLSEKLQFAWRERGDGYRCFANGVCFAAIFIAYKSVGWTYRIWLPDGMHNSKEGRTNTLNECRTTTEEYIREWFRQLENDGNV